jgi:hypothetical protein
MSNFDWSFPKRILFIVAIAVIIGFYPLYLYGNIQITKSVIVGTILAILNVLLGYAAIEYSIGKSTTTFFKYVLGGMGIRLFFMALLLVVFIKLFYFHVTALIVSLGIFYGIFLVLEILHIQKKIEIKQHN